MPIPPVFDAHSTAVFLACDDRFMPHTLAAIASIMENACPDARYDIIVLTDSIPQGKTNEAVSWFAKYPNVSLRFFDVKDELEAFGRNRFHVTARYPVSIYFRFFAPTLFAEYSRIIYLDSDVIVLTDIAALFREDLQGNILGACHDVMFEETFRAVAGTPDATYAETVLGLAPDDGYFNTGTLLFDLEKMRSHRIQEKLFDALARIESPSLPDQDILNSICKGSVRFLDISWNLQDWMADPAETCAKFHFAGEATKALCRASRLRPCNILHFSERKPWSRLYSGTLGSHYWRYASLTPQYPHTLAAWQQDNTPQAFLKEAARCLFHLARCGVSYAFGDSKARSKNKRRLYDYYDILRAIKQNFLKKTPA